MSNSSTNTSWPASTLPVYWTEPLSLTTLRLLLEVAIALMGIIGNILVYIVMTKSLHVNPSLSNYIRNLAAADLGILLMNFPFAVIREQMPFRWPLGEFICLYVYPLSEMFYGASIWSIVAIAVERYRTTVGTSSTANPTSAKIARLVLVSIWLISFFLIDFPLLLFMQYEPTRLVCSIQWPGRLVFNPIAQLYVIVVTMFWFLLPLCLISWTYYQISQRINNHSTTLQQRIHNQFHLNQFPSQVQRVGMRQIEKTKKILTPLVLAFVVTMLPSSVFRLMTVYIPTFPWTTYYLVYYNVFVILTVANSAANPLIYCLVSREFRRGVITLFSKCFRGKVQPQMEITRSKAIHPTVVFTSRIATFPPIETSFSLE